MKQIYHKNNTDKFVEKIHRQKLQTYRYLVRHIN